jgi:hypothetical protein
VKEDSSGQWMTLRKIDVTGIRKRQLYFGLYGELALEEAMDLS